MREHVALQVSTYLPPSLFLSLPLSVWAMHLFHTGAAKHERVKVDRKREAAEAWGPGVLIHRHCSQILVAKVAVAKGLHTHTWNTSGHV